MPLVPHIAVPGKNRPKALEDFSWVKTDGHRVINKCGLTTPQRPHSSNDTTGTSEEATAMFTVVNKDLKVTHVPSSTASRHSEEEAEYIVQTRAIGYRPVLSARQKTLTKSHNLTACDPAYECFSRDGSGYPRVHSKRRREVKSASVYDRRMQRPVTCCGRITMSAPVDTYAT